MKMIPNVTDEVLLPSRTSRGRIGYRGNICLSVYENHDVAVKHFLENVNTDIRYQELELLSQFNNEKIIKVLAAGPDFQNGSLDFLVLEYASCGDLYGVIFGNESEYNLSNALLWMLQISEALSYLHDDCSPPILHNDVKPANLLLFARGQSLKLADFGSAKRLAQNSKNHENDNQTLSGTIAYMAPELLSRTSHDLDVQSDVFSAAITFWEILAGEHASSLEERGFVTICQRVSRQQRPPPLLNCHDLLQSLLTRSWDENPRRRPRIREVFLFLQFVKTTLLNTHMLPDPLPIQTVSELHNMNNKMDDNEWVSEDEDWFQSSTGCIPDEIVLEACPAECLQGVITQLEPCELSISCDDAD